MGVLRRAGNDRFRVQQHRLRENVPGNVFDEQRRPDGRGVGPTRVQRQDRRQLSSGAVHRVHQHQVDVVADRRTVRPNLFGKCGARAVSPPYTETDNASAAFRVLQAKARSFEKFELFSRNHWSMNSLSLFCNKNSFFLRACVSVLSEFFGFDTSGNSTVSSHFRR